MLDSSSLVESGILQAKLLGEEIRHQGIQLDRPLQLLLLTQASDNDVVLLALLLHTVYPSRQFDYLDVLRSHNFVRFGQL